MNSPQKNFQLNRRKSGTDFGYQYTYLRKLRTYKKENFYYLGTVGDALKNIQQQNREKI